MSLNAEGQQTSPADASLKAASLSCTIGKSTIKSRLSVCTPSLSSGTDDTEARSTPGSGAAHHAAADDGQPAKTGLTAAEMLALASIPQPAAESRLPEDDRGSLVESPNNGSHALTAAEAAAQEEFSKLLTGKVSKARASLVGSAPPAVAATASGRYETAGEQLAPSSGTVTLQDSQGSSAGGSRPSVMATAARFSLANIGLLAAPGASLLPGSLAEGSVAGIAAADSPTGANKPAAARQSIYQPRSSVATAAAAQGLSVPTADAAVHSSARQDTPVAPRTATMQQKLLELQQRSAQQLHDNPRSGTDDAADGQVQQGSAAFRSTTREQANRIGRVHVAEDDSPGPGHYRPTTAAMQKHVPSMHIAGHSSTSGSPGRLAVPASTDQQPQASGSPQKESIALEQKRMSATAAPNPASLATPAGVLALQAAATAVRGSATDITPRLDADLAQTGPLGLQGRRVHPRQKAQKGTAAFKTTTREQRDRQGKLGRPASASAATALPGRQSPPASSSGAANHYSSAGSANSRAGAPSGGSGDYLNGSYDHLTRPRSSRGPSVAFSKQTARPASPAAADTPAALGPGSYHRTGQLPHSYTGADVPAGHPDARVERTPDIGKYSCRPGTSPAAFGSSHRAGSSVQAAPAADWPGLWGWAAAAEGCVYQSGHTSGEDAADPALQQAAERPSSRAALTYAREQLAPELVPEQQHQLQEPVLQTAGTIDLLQRQESQKRPVSVAGHQRQQATRSAGRVRPASAGAALAGSAAARASSLLQAYGMPGLLNRPGTSSPTSSSRRDGVLGLDELHRFSSTGLAPRVKGGGFSTGSREAAAKVLRAMSVGSVVPPAAVAVLQPGTELSYEPNPEVQGHMHRSPGWSLPPNRIATSRKWAQLAQQAALQP